MKIVYNPFQGNLDYVGDTTGGGGGPSTKYSDSFVVLDWTLNVSVYDITYLASTHGAGTTPIVQVFEVAGGVATEVTVNTHFNALGDVTITVTSLPDNRFIGRINII